MTDKIDNETDVNGICYYCKNKKRHPEYGMHHSYLRNEEI